MSSIVAIDPRVADSSLLARAWQAHAEVVVLDPGASPLAALAALVEARPGTCSLHLVAHGGPGRIELGGTVIDAAALAAQADALERLGTALGPDGALLLYACRAAAGHAGEVFLARLAELSGLDVAASSELVGAPERGGSWHLDARHGVVSPAPLPAVAGYPHTLVNQTGDGSDNLLEGSPDLDILAGAGGADTLLGGDGDDFLYGYLGLSGLDPGGVDGADFIDGGAGNDVLRGNSGNDTLLGGSGDDNLRGDAGDDLIDGGEGLDYVSYRFDELGLGAGVLFDVSAAGGPGTTLLADGRGGVDTLVDVEAFVFSGTAFDDTFVGSSGSDQANGNGGDDVLNGNDGDDTLIASQGNDSFDGGDGSDAVLVIMDSQAGPVLLTLDGIDLRDAGLVLALGPAGGTMTLTNMERLELALSDSADSLLGALSDDYIDGLAGNDTLDGNAGNDSLWGSDGTDKLRGGTGNDSLLGGASGTDGGNELTGGAGNDTLDGTGGISYALYESAAGGVLANLATGSASDGDGGTDTLIAIAGVGGSSFDDTLIGSAGDDAFGGLGGNDSIDGGAGIDTVYFDQDEITGSVLVNLATQSASGTGQGNDTLVGIENVVGSLQADTMAGDGVANRLAGAAGNDSLDGAGGADTLQGGLGDDSLNGASGDDVLEGGDGFDIAFYSGAVGAVNVDLATGRASGADGSDTLLGLKGAVGGDGNDTLVGSVNGDFLAGGLGADLIDGGLGSDRASFAIASAAVTVSLATGLASGGAGNDTLAGIENLRGSNFGDTLAGNAGNNDIQARGGDDTVDGGDGDDFLQGEDGNDSLVGGNGEDLLAGGAGNDTLDGGAQPVQAGRTFFDVADFSGAAGPVGVDLVGNTATGQGSDVLIGIEGARGSAGNDTLSGNAGDNLFRGNAGDDAMTGGDGFDIVDYGNAAGAVQVNLGDGSATGAAGNDSFSGFEMAIGGAFGDALTGSAGDDILRGNGGNDTLAGGDGIDRADYRVAAGAVAVNLATGQSSGADGADVLSGIENVRGSDVGNDTLTGNAGANLLEGRGGQDVLAGGAGNDTLDGGTITDLINYTDLNFADYSAAAGGVNLSLQAGSANDGEGGTDTLRNINAVTGSAHDDTLTGSTALLFEQFAGGAGNDRIDGGAVTDTLHQVNVNRVTYASAGQSVTVDLRDGTASGASIGSDTLINIQQVAGSGANDTLRGSDSPVLTEQFRGNAGDDLIDGRGGIDVARYDTGTAGADVNLALGTAQDGLGGTDTLVGIEGVRGSNFNDTLTGGLAANDAFEFFIGQGGSDTIDGGRGYDRADYTTSTAGVVATLGGAGDGTALDGLGGIDTLRNVEGLRGSTFDDRLSGSAIATLETFEGREGNDTLDGGGGLDRAVYQFARAAVTVNLATGTAGDGDGGTDTLIAIDDVTGSRDFADTLTGNSGANRLEGLGGNDTLDGGTGNDTLVGGTGNDTYVVNVATDVVSETSTSASEIDTVRSAATWTLGANLERLVLTGSAAINGIGNGLNNTLTGNAAANLLNGGTGNDTLTGGAGGDTYVVDAVGDVISETGSVASEIDTVRAAATWTLGANLENLVLTGTAAINGTGNTDDNAITGNAAANLLDGRAGSDTLIGGAGNDSYVVDLATDVINEAGTLATEIDTVRAGITWTLGANLERLVLTGTAANGTGNALDNTITGNAAANTLNGGTGNDTLAGGAGNDTYVVDVATDVITESSTVASEIDTVRAAATWTLGANLENLVLTGSAAINGTGNTDDNTITGNAAANLLAGAAGQDTLSGGAGNDTLNGGTGSDSLSGGIGNDTYVVDAGTDVISETSTVASEIDTVLAAFNWTLGTNLENLTLTGSAALSGTGNSLANTLTGNAGGNVLNGGSGNDTINGAGGADTLAGGLGNDSLLGGSGADSFLFNTTRSATGNVDRLADFSSVDDRLLLDDAVFAGIGPVGQLAAANFRLGAAAGDASDRVIYNAATGQLFFDADGSGAAAQVLFATVTAGTTLTAADIFIV